MLNISTPLFTFKNTNMATKERNNAHFMEEILVKLEQDTAQIDSATIEAGIEYVFHDKPMQPGIPNALKQALSYCKSIRNLYGLKTPENLHCWIDDLQDRTARFLQLYSEGNLLQKIFIEQGVREVHQLEDEDHCLHRKSFFYRATALKQNKPLKSAVRPARVKAGGKNGKASKKIKVKDIQHSCIWSDMSHKTASAVTAEVDSTTIITAV